MNRSNRNSIAVTKLLKWTMKPNHNCEWFIFLTSYTIISSINTNIIKSQYSTCEPLSAGRSLKPKWWNNPIFCSDKQETRCERALCHRICLISCFSSWLAKSGIQLYRYSVTCRQSTQAWVCSAHSRPATLTEWQLFSFKITYFCHVVSDKATCEAWSAFYIRNQTLVVIALLLYLTYMTSRLTNRSPVIDNRSTTTGVWLWSPYGIGQAIIFSSCRLFYLSIFFPRLISAIAHWMSAILAHMVWP